MGLLDWITESAKAQYAKGAPYRQAVSGLLQGDATQLGMLAQDFNKRAQTPEGALDVALNFAPMGILSVKPSSMPSIQGITEPYISSGVKFDVMEYPAKNEIYLSRIEVPKEKRNSGIGTKAMQDLIDYANQTNQKITLSPSTDFGATSVNRLKNFYKKFGFVENKGKNKDFSTRESMYKVPNN